MKIPITAFSSTSVSGAGNELLAEYLKSNQTQLKPINLFELPFATVVGEVGEQLPHIRSDLEKYHSRNAQIALMTLNNPYDGVRVAVENAKERYGADRVGVIIGTSTSGLFETESAYAKLLQQGRMPDDFHFLTRHAYQATPRFLQLELGLKGLCYAVSTACSSASKAIGAAQRMIELDVCDAVLTGGVDTLCRLTLRGFNSLELISSQQCRPMDQHRSGINIGEGAGLLLLEKPQPECHDFPHVVAVGESSDAYHMSSPHPEGVGAVLAMQRALEGADLKARDIDYINLHATATPINDHIEALAIDKIFETEVPCSGTKGMTGHALGAAGAIEAIVSLLALQQEFLPGTCGLQEKDAECHAYILTEPVLDRKIKTVMSNSFGFGGNNASAIFSLL